jgi:enamine deaminase RidA (YjgF/YER057c/UK114 family)
MKIISVNVGLPREVVWQGASISTGIFKDPRPVRTTVGVAKLVGTARIEITVIAHK